MADTLTAIGQTVEASDVVAYILTGLPSEYDSLVAAVTTLIEIVTVDALYGFLLSHELRLEQQTATAELGQPTANLANRTTSNSGRGGSRPPFFNNSHGGHSKGRGRGRGNAPLSSFNARNQQGTRPVCHICLKAEHTAPNCWHRFEQNYQPQSNAQAYTATTPATNDSTWYPDTGANNHITSNLNHLNLNIEDYTGPDQVRVGNGQGLIIHHIGSSVLCSSSKTFFLNNVLPVPSIKRTYFLSINLLKTIMFSLNFTLPFSV